MHNFRLMEDNGRYRLNNRITFRLSEKKIVINDPQISDKRSRTLHYIVSIKKEHVMDTNVPQNRSVLPLALFLFTGKCGLVVED